MEFSGNNFFLIDFIWFFHIYFFRTFCFQKGRKGEFFVLFFFCFLFFFFFYMGKALRGKRNEKKTKKKNIKNKKKIVVGEC